MVSAWYGAGACGCMIYGRVLKWTRWKTQKRRLELEAA